MCMWQLMHFILYTPATDSFFRWVDIVLPLRKCLFVRLSICQCQFQCLGWVILISVMQNRGRKIIVLTEVCVLQDLILFTISLCYYGTGYNNILFVYLSLSFLYLNLEIVYIKLNYENIWQIFAVFGIKSFYFTRATSAKLSRQVS